MKSLRELIAEAEKQKIAIGHFNVSNLEMIWAVFYSAQKLNVPVIIGLSEGERNFVGVRQAVAIIKSIREQHDFPIFLNADHSYQFEKVKEAVEAGFDAVIFDGAKLPFDQNLKITKESVRFVKNFNNENKMDVLIEAELGFIGQSSKVFDEIPKEVKISPDDLTTAEQAQKFAAETNIDLLAPAVGNIHGMMRVGHDPFLNISRIAQIKTAAKIPLVLHGGSGTVDDDFKKAMEAGISIIHISTELRVAYRKALVLSLQENQEEVAPYKYLKEPLAAVERVVEARLKLFNKI